MNIQNSNDLLHQPEYTNVLERIPNTILLGFGGSIAYGTNVESSDIDLRGIYMNNIEEVLGTKPDSEQFVDSNTDTVIYSFKKMLTLLTKNNPNTIEILGLRSQDYLIMTEAGRLLVDNRGIFLSQRTIYSFGQYALSQLNRLINKSGRATGHLVENEKRSYEKAFKSFSDRHKKFLENGSVSVEVKNSELLLSFSIKDLPIGQVAAVLNEINSIDRSYRKSTRNDKAIAHNKLPNHQMHLLRLFMMGIDILENGEIITYREDEHDLLMSIRNGDYLEADKKTPTKEFMKLKDEYEKRFNKAAENTKLPKEPDFKKINELAMKINRMYL